MAAGVTAYSYYLPPSIYFLPIMFACYMKNHFAFLLMVFLFATTHQAQAQLPMLASPNGSIVVRVSSGEALTYTVLLKGVAITGACTVDMELRGGSKFSNGLAGATVEQKSVNEIIAPTVAEKRSRIPDVYNQLSLSLANGFGIEFRAYNDGVAYRIVTRLKDSITVKAETAIFQFLPGSNIIAPLVEKRADEDIYHTSYEALYTHAPVDSLGGVDLMFSPVVVEEGGIKLGLTESDLLDYPGMFLKGNKDVSLQGDFAPYPATEMVTNADYPEKIVTAREGFIAKTNGSRNFPWRVLLIAEQDKDLPGNDLVYRLATPTRIKDATWIHPGKCTDEWIVGINLFNVPFKTGVNTACYKYYIDFAKRFGFDRIMMDAGWSDYKDLFKINPNINMGELTAYAKAKGIKISMWTDAATLDRQLDSALAQFKKWGVDFIMTDFIDRDDQKTVNFYTRIAEACAAAKLMIMFHGAYPPKGFSRTYPNNITRESVLGSEYNIWSSKPTPSHDVTLPFTRMLSGALDYEPGILDNATKEQFRPINEKVMSQGTRCHQLAMFVVYDNPMQIFSGNPSQGLLEPKFMELLGSLPTTWDETKVLEAKVGSYIITARQKGQNWYIGGMTDWQERDFEVPFDFIGEGSYTLTSCVDGANAERYAADYSISTQAVKKHSKLHVHLAPGGGFLLKLVK